MGPDETEKAFDLVQAGSQKGGVTMIRSTMRAAVTAACLIGMTNS